MYTAPGGEKSISIAVVNALSHMLTVEIRREGRIFRQEYKQGIPQTGLLVVGSTGETGTSVTFKPDPELFEMGWSMEAIESRMHVIMASEPGLTISVEGGNAGRTV